MSKTPEQEYQEYGLLFAHYLKERTGVGWAIWLKPMSNFSVQIRAVQPQANLTLDTPVFDVRYIRESEFSRYTDEFAKRFQERSNMIEFPETTLKEFEDELPSWITIERFPLYPKWEATYVEWVAVDDPCNNGSTNVYVRTDMGERNYQQGISVFQDWGDDRAVEITKPAGEILYCNAEYGASFFMSGDSSFDPAKGQAGPYSFYVLGNSDKVKGFGLPLKRHVQGKVVFTYVDKPTPPVPPVGRVWIVTEQSKHRIVLEKVKPS